METVKSYGVGRVTGTVDKVTVRNGVGVASFFAERLSLLTTRCS